MTDTDKPALIPAPLRGPLWVLLALLGGLSVALVNGQPLYYYDSVGYLDTGVKTLQFLGFMPDPTTLAANGEEVGGLAADGVINASRSVVYSLFAAIVTYGLGPFWVPVLHMAGTLLAIMFLLRILMRGPAARAGNLLQVSGVVILAACFGSLPFFIAYFMPDILTGLLILSIAVLTVAWQRMARWEIALVVFLGVVAVLAHPSHLLIAAVMVPLVALAGIWVAAWKWWVPVVLTGVIMAGGVAERIGFTLVAEESLDAEVTLFPFLTARLIEDGVGMTYLGEICPDEDTASCALYDILKDSDDWLRHTASHILFEFSADQGSLRLLPEDVQRQIAAEQVGFSLRVFAAHPIATTGAVARNTWRQARMFSIWMTVPEAETMRLFAPLPDAGSGMFDGGRLIAERGWIDRVEGLHSLFYLACAILLVGLAVLPLGMRGETRVLVALVLLGILANAFVCGTVSQPADRYGARVIWLLPFLTALAFLVRPTRTAI